MLSVIVPAVRGSEESLRACAASLAAGNEPGWVLGEHWELLLVGASAGLAAEFPGARVLPLVEAPPDSLYNHALATGAEAARGQWLLFTEPGTVHTAGAASRAVVEAERYGVGVLSYAARWAGGGLLERALLPMILSEIATAYPPAQVNDPAKRIAYAAEQFLLVRADRYRELGGHSALASSRISAVDLAFLAKRREVGLRYRYAPEAVSARLPAGLGPMWREWSGRLGLLIHNTLALGAWRTLDFLLLWGLLLLALFYPVPFTWERVVLWLLWLRNAWRVYRRAARSHQPAADLLPALTLGLPMFAALCFLSSARARLR